MVYVELCFDAVYCLLLVVPLLYVPIWIKYELYPFYFFSCLLYQKAQ